MGSSLQVQLINPATSQLPYTITGQDILTNTCRVASRRGSEFAEPMDLLLGIADQAHGAGGAIIRELVRGESEKLKISPYEYLKRKLGFTFGDTRTKPEQIRRTLLLEQVLQRSEELATSRKKNVVDTTDLLRAIFQVASNDPKVAELGVTSQVVEDEVSKYLSWLDRYRRVL